jgi:membrane protein implicated in regulation of membrane protease activity
MDSPESWKWIWLATAAVFFVGEMATPGSFFLLPFAIGGAVAAAAGFAGTEVWVQWALFVGVSVAAFLAMRPLAKRLDANVDDSGIGVKRMVGGVATTIATISGDVGSIKFESEEWRAVSEDGSTIPAGTAVTIVEVRGTRAVVRPSA